MYVCMYVCIIYLESVDKIKIYRNENKINLNLVRLIDPHCNARRDEYKSDKINCIRSLQ